MKLESKWFWIFLGFFLLDLVTILVPLGSLVLLIGAFFPSILREIGKVLLEYAGPEPTAPAPPTTPAPPPDPPAPPA